MSRPSLVSTVADALLERVVSGELPAGSELPSEAELATAHGVSRVTMREALKRLQAQGVVGASQGRRGVVRPRQDWNDLDAILLAAVRTDGSDAASASRELVELRAVIESGAAALAAGHRTGEDLDELDRLTGRMRDAHAAGDVAGFVSADIDFHDVILRASGNRFLTVVFAPLGRLLEQKRAQTSAVAEIRVNAIAMHEAVAAALRSGDSERSRLAMAAHLRQTADDLDHYLLEGADDR
ncbi:FadR/GntR family transcriptional regulator [Mycetocola reblochoni]|uniref:Transcriptional regulator, GntR family n=2 Tax=Mycetocola reblochoni TaxID=331618 RepID=A0A1R4IKR5_9MICO|nr:FadR/GntR family transcriptional regulator [Mycetocola reblochoni]RLP67794.1 FadR family transcriptional regulator [Mycetocola reblochoni]SJN20164.1 Transcriptional regulator, GntR family [Mycetocola reblochoni REB411]